MKRLLLASLLIGSLLPICASENVFFHVADQYGYPLPGALISVDLQHVRTDVYGNAALMLSRNNHLIIVSKEGYATHVTSFTVIGNHKLHLTLQSSRIAIHVLVKDLYGRPLPSVLVSAGNMADNARNATDISGHALLFLPKGGYIITAQKEGYEVAERRGVIENSTIIELYMNNLGMGTISGLLLFGGNPLPFIEVIAVQENGSYSYAAKTGADGRFVVEVPKHGSYTIVVPKFGKILKGVTPKRGLPPAMRICVG